MAQDPFAVEQLRLRLARSLPTNCFDDFQRLSRTLLHGPAFQWLLVDAPHEGLRNQVMKALDDVLSAAGLSVNRLPLSGRIDDVPALEARLVNNAGKAQVVHVIGRPGWFTAARWDAFNARRERVAAQAKARLVFWLDAPAIELASRGAPDLWAWRGGVYAFVDESGPAAVAATEARLAQSARPAGPDTRSATQRYRRMADIRAWLEAHPDAPDDLQVSPLDELGRLLYEAGEYDEALAHWRERELPLHRRRGDEKALAITVGQIADVLQARGQFDEALRIRREQELPVYEKLGDLRAVAVTHGQIADVLQARGQLDEALRIRREEVLPAFERLGDERACAVIQGRIADLLQARGELDEALRIRREKELPVYEKLGDARSVAVTQGKFADVLQARGQLDEALRIRREEELPVYEKLGDVYSRAVSQSKIADVLQARGQADEALRIRREVVPVFDRLGDVRERAVTQWKIGIQLLELQPPQRQAAQALLDAAYADLKRLGLPEAEDLASQVPTLGLVRPGDAARR
jgi:tetratricopeptide (TPR) repeat protein